jgi:hypothetical protein
MAQVQASLFPQYSPFHKGMGIMTTMDLILFLKADIEKTGKDKR